MDRRYEFYLALHHGYCFYPTISLVSIVHQGAVTGLGGTGLNATKI
jgi:hypothetical protein